MQTEAGKSRNSDTVITDIQIGNRETKIPIPQGRREKLIYAKLDRDAS